MIKRIAISILFAFSFAACGGGGGGGGGDQGYLGVWQGTFYLSSNSCAHPGDPDFDTVLTVNEDSSRFIVEESTDGESRIFVGPPNQLEEEHSATAQDVMQCYYGGDTNRPAPYTYTVIRSMTLSQPEGGQMLVKRSLKESGCIGNVDCLKEWQGSFTKIAG